MNEGETCIHGNSWHSECLECDDLMLIDTLFDLVDSTPNDIELGSKVRSLLNEFREGYEEEEEKADSGEIPSDTTENNDYDLTNDPATKDRKRWGG